MIQTFKGNILALLFSITVLTPSTIRIMRTTCIHYIWDSYLNDFVEIGILSSCIFILAKNVMDGLSWLKILYFIFFKIERSIIFTGESLDVGQPERVGVGSLTKEMECQCYIAHGLKNSILRIQGSWINQERWGAKLILRGKYNPRLTLN